MPGKLKLKAVSLSMDSLPLYGCVCGGACVCAYECAYECVCVCAWVRLCACEWVFVRSPIFVSRVCSTMADLFPQLGSFPSLLPAPRFPGEKVKSL